MQNNILEPCIKDAIMSPMLGVRMIPLLFIIFDGNEIKDHPDVLSSQAIRSNFNANQPSRLKVFVSLQT
jgi:hypothetical protein